MGDFALVLKLDSVVGLHLSSGLPSRSSFTTLTWRADSSCHSVPLASENISKFRHLLSRAATRAAAGDGMPPTPFLPASSLLGKRKAVGDAGSTEEPSMQLPKPVLSLHGHGPFPRPVA